MSVNDIQRARHRPQHHAPNLAREEEIRQEPSIPSHMLRRDPKPIQSRAPKHQLRSHQHDPEFRFVNPPVPSDHVSCRPIRQQARKDEAEDGAHERSGVHIPGLDFVEPQRRTEEDGREDDADHDGPADEGALDEAGPEDGRVEEEGKGAKEQFEEVDIAFAAVEGEEGL